MRNYLYSEWVNSHSYAIHVVVAGLVTLVITVVRVGGRRYQQTLHPFPVSAAALQPIDATCCCCLSQACILFGLGLVIVTMQLSIRLVCSEIASLNFKSVSVSDVCVTIPPGERCSGQAPYLGTACGGDDCLSFSLPAAPVPLPPEKSSEPNLRLGGAPEV